jgi:hypothetical protein
VLQSNEQLDIHEGEWCGCGGTASVLTRLEEEEEGGAGHVSNGQAIGHAQKGSNIEGMVYDRDWNGFDAIWR